MDVPAADGIAHHEVVVGGALPGEEYESVADDPAPPLG